jgi:hypothetical protein
MFHTRVPRTDAPLDEATEVFLGRREPLSGIVCTAAGPEKLTRVPGEEA